MIAEALTEIISAGSIPAILLNRDRQNMNLNRNRRGRTCRVWFLILVIAGGSGVSVNAELPEFLASARRILFLGDSITHAGHYISQLETQLRLRRPGNVPELVNLGLSSETCSGLSEPDHPFPRPDVHERLDRALDKIQPDVVVACYGMNDGIYYPFSEKRFDAWKNGINRLIEKVQATGARLILMTPPPFDPLPLRKQGKLRPLGSERYAFFAIYEDYDDVLSRYAAWIMEQRDRIDLVIDLHTPVNEYISEKRKTNADFTMSPDGVHVNVEGHQVLSTAILSAWGMGKPLRVPAEMLNLVEQRQRLLHNAWLSDVGHQRPGVEPGLPLEQANARAEQIEQLILNVSHQP
jgi:lysophospholipase L1-like esterase